MEGASDIVIGIAPWSSADLAALEELARIGPPANVQVSVFDIDDIKPTEMARLLPGFRLFRNTPVVLWYRTDDLAYFGEGRDALSWLSQF